MKTQWKGFGGMLNTGLFDIGGAIKYQEQNINHPEIYRYTIRNRDYPDCRWYERNDKQYSTFQAALREIGL